MDLKPLHHSAIGTALEKARHYRLLNDPENAESICLDILEHEPDHEEALLTLILSLTDQFDGGSRIVKQAREYLQRMKSEYQQEYLAGLILERAARAVMKRNTRQSAYTAWEWLTQAMENYEKAEALSADDNDDAILRWNACARTIEKRKLTPRPADNYVQPYGDGFPQAAEGHE
ncbi:MAG: hypothetical protein ACR2NP_19195 [Pirellulaceae bacterium]